MRVLLVSSLLRGGPVEQTLVLATGLAAAGVSVHVVCASDDLVARFARAGVSAEASPLEPGLDVRGARALWRSMRSADLVHAQDRRSGLWTRLAPVRVPVVYTVHGLPDGYLPPPAGPGAPSIRDRLAYEGLDALLTRRAAAVIVPSAAQAEVFRRRLRFPASRIRVVPNGVDVPDPAPHGGSLIGTMSVLEPVKDIGTFLAAARILAAKRPDLRFAVFGEGSARPALERVAHELGLAGSVRFAGHVPRDEALGQLAVLVLPSLVETAPMGLLEALAAGIPVVASSVGGIPEIAGTDTALLVDPRDARGFAGAIASLLDDPAAAHRRATAGRARVAARFSREHNVAATRAVYEEALRRP